MIEDLCEFKKKTPSEPTPKAGKNTKTGADLGMSSTKASIAPYTIVCEQPLYQEVVRN